MIPFLLAVLTVAAALAAGWSLRARAYRRFFRYRVCSDQRFSFPAGQSSEVPLGADGFIWPERLGTPDTALLEIRIRPALTGRWSEPWIEMRTRHFYARQYFERGAHGTRYLNLSALLTEPPQAGQRIHLHGFAATWETQAARLLCFDHSWSADARSVIIAPHPDDAEIAAFGLFRNPESTVVTVTAGDHGTFFRGHLPADDPRTSALTARLRAWDSITAPMIGGVPPSRAVNLGYIDSTLADAFSDPETPVIANNVRRSMAEIRGLNLSPLIGIADVPPTWRALVSDLVRILEKTGATLVVTPHPLLDDHPDHAFATVAVCDALAQIGARAGHLLLYTNHTPWSNLHPVGRNDGTVSLPPHFGEPLTFRSIKSLPLTDEDQRLKMLAIEAHHDLRSLPARHMPGITELCRAFVAGVRDRITGLDRHATSYDRRAVRPNELFFVIPFSDAASLRREFLEAWRAGKVEWHRSK